MLKSIHVLVLRVQLPGAGNVSEVLDYSKNHVQFSNFRILAACANGAEPCTRF